VEKNIGDNDVVLHKFKKLVLFERNSIWLQNYIFTKRMLQKILQNI